MQNDALATAAAPADVNQESFLRHLVSYSAYNHPLRDQQYPSDYEYRSWSSCILHLSAKSPRSSCCIGFCYCSTAEPAAMNGDDGCLIITIRHH